MATSQQLQQALEKAKQNPNSEFATELRRRIEAGRFDTQLSELGIPRPGTQPQVGTQAEGEEQGPGLFKQGLRRVADVATGGLSELAQPADERSKSAQGKIGATKGVLSSLSGLGELVSRGASKLTGGRLGSTEAPKLQEIRETQLAPETGFEKAGFAAEQIGEFFIPAGAASKINKAIQSSGVSPKIAKTVETLLRAAGSAGVISAQEGKVGTGTGIAAGTELLAPGAGVIAKGFGRVGGRILKSLASGLSGSSGEALDLIIKNPEKAKQLIGQIDTSGTQQILRKNSQAILDGITKVRKEASKNFGEALEQIGATDIKPDKFRNSVQKTLDKFKISSSQGERTLQGVEFDDPKNIQKASDLIDRLSNVELDGKSLRKLSKDIADARFKTTGDSAERLAFNAFIDDLSRSLTKAIGTATTKLDEANKAFSQDMQLVEGIQGIFGKTKFKNLDELRKVSERLESLFAKKGLSPQVIDDFLTRAGIDPTDFRTSEAVRQITDLPQRPNTPGFSIGEVLQKLTSSVVTPEIVRDLSVFTGLSTQVLKPVLEALPPAARATFIKLFSEVAE